MQRDLFYEESAASNRAKTESKLYMLFLVVSIIAFAAAGISAFFATSAFQGILGSDADTAAKIIPIVQWILFILAFLGIGLVFWFLKKKFNVSYDYVFVEDELRVTKVFNGRSRKFFTTIASDAVLRIGWVEKPSFSDALRGLQGKKAVYLTPNKTPADDKEFIYLLVSGALGKTLYVIECRRELLEYLVQAAGINKLERE